MHQYLGHFSYVIISVYRLIRMKRSEATRKKKKKNNKEKSPILAWCSVEYRSRTRVKSSISVIAWEETLYRLSPQVLHTEKETSRERKKNYCSCQRNGKTSALYSQEAQIV